MYNLTFIDTNNTLYEFAYQINLLSGHVIFSVLLLILFLTIVAATKHYDTKASLVAATFITALISAGFVFLGFIKFNLIFYVIVGVIAAIIIYLFRE